MIDRPAPLRWPGAAIPVLALALVTGCDRAAEIYDPPTAEVSTDSVPGPGEPIEPVDVDFDAPDLRPCEERSFARCEGGTDFPCMPEVFLDPALRDCFRESDCQVDGWVQIDLGDDGCAEELRMQDPEPAYVDCVVERLTEGRCVCGAWTHEVYFGLGNDGCSDDAD